MRSREVREQGGAGRVSRPVWPGIIYQVIVIQTLHSRAHQSAWWEWSFLFLLVAHCLLFSVWWLKMIDNNDRNKCNNRNNFLILSISFAKKRDEILAWRVWRWLVTSVVRVLGPPWIKYNILPSDAPLNMSHSEFSDVRGNKKLWRGSSWSHMASREWLIRGLGLSPVSLDCLSADKRSLMTH